MALVDATKYRLGFIFSVISVAQIEGEHRAVQQPLVEHIVRWGSDVVHADGVVSKTKDAIESSKSECQTRFRCRLGEILFLDLHITNSKSVLRHVSAKASRAISNFES